MIALGLEPEPLAFRVRPLADECFDSWIDRVTRAHETTRAALFRHVEAQMARLESGKPLEHVVDRAAGY